MAQANLSTVPYIYKSVYAGQKPQNLASRDRIALSLMKKVGGFTGNNFILAVQHGNNMGVSGTFANAQAGGDTTKGVAFTYTRVRKYGVGTIDAEAAEASGDDKGAFVRLVTTQMDSTVDELGHRLAIALYNDKSGNIGVCSNDPVDAGGPIILTQADDARNFAVGQAILAYSVRSGTPGSIRAIVGTPTVTAIDEDLGTISYSGTITGITTGDFLYTAGDYDQDLSGFAAMFPLVAPVGGDNFFGVDRSVQVQRLSGWRVTTTSISIEENMKKLAAKIRRAGGRPKHAFLSPINWNTLQNNLESKVERSSGGDAEFGFDSLLMATPAGLIRVYADPECPPDRGYILDMSTLMVKYLGPGIPHICDDLDGLRMLRQGSADGMEYRFRYWGQAMCSAPGFNGVFQIS